MVTNAGLFKYNRNEVVRIATNLVNTNAIVIDTETTGLGERDEIIEIGII